MGKFGLLIIDVNNIGVAIGDSNTEELKWSFSCRHVLPPSVLAYDPIADFWT